MEMSKNGQTAKTLSFLYCFLLVCQLYLHLKAAKVNSLEDSPTYDKTMEESLTTGISISLFNNKYSLSQGFTKLSAVRPPSVEYPNTYTTCTVI